MATNTPALAGQDRCVYLDGLRGVGAVVVALTHFYYAYPLMSDAVNSRLFNGTAAVGMFFTLSGYVLARKLLRQDMDVPLLAKFYVARFFRIWPPFLAVMALALYLHELPMANVHELGALFKRRWELPINYEKTLNDLRPTIAYHAQLLAPSWTLLPELMMSLWLPVLILLVRKSTVFLVFFFLTAYWLTEASLLAGFVAGIVYARHQQAIDLRMTPAWRWGVLVLCVLAYFGIEQSSFTGRHGYAFWGVLSMFGVAALGSSPFLRKLLETRVLAYLGTVSFGVYLIHWPLLGLASWLFWFGLGGGLTVLIWLLGCVLAAGVFHVTVEQVFIRMGKRLGNQCVTLGERVVEKMAAGIRPHAQRQRELPLKTLSLTPEQSNLPLDPLRTPAGESPSAAAV